MIEYFHFLPLCTYKFSVYIVIHQTYTDNVYFRLNFGGEGALPPATPDINSFKECVEKNVFFCHFYILQHFKKHFFERDNSLLLYLYVKAIIWLVKLYFSKVFSLNVYVIWVENNLSNGVFI